MRTHGLLRHGLLAGLALAGAATASAGEWKLDPKLCPDLREDHADMRVDHGPRDRHEDVHDMRQVTCPRTAWVYVPDPGERAGRHMAYEGPLTVHVGKAGYYRVNPRADGKPPEPVLINVIIR